jgi:hypothetical protein
MTKYLYTFTMSNCYKVQTFYEACGYMISAQGNKAIQETLVAKLMEIPNHAVH